MTKTSDIPKTVTVPLSKIKLNPSNPRTIRDDRFKKLVESIKTFPEMLRIRPIVVNEDMVILGGNMRLKACQAAGIKEVPVIIASNLSASQQREFVIKDNVGFGDWDWELLVKDWDAVELEDWGLEVPEAFVEPPERPKVDLTGFTDLPSNIICGNNVDVLKGFEADSIDLTVTSPPYDNLRQYNGYEFDFEPLARELYRVTKPGGVVVWVVNDATIDGSETGTSFKQALYFKECGFNLHDTMIWRRCTIPQSGPRYESCFEFMFVFSKGAPLAFNPIMTDKLYTDNRKEKQGHRGSDGVPTMLTVSQRTDKPRYNIWDIPVGGGHVATDELASEHPAIFPEHLAEDHILSWSNEGDTVLDPFCGSGTTLKMAKLNGRRYIGIDISEEYCAISNKRVAEASNAGR